MIVYGELERLERSAEVNASAAGALQHAGQMTPGIDRHSALVRAFIRTAELVQGIADAEFHAYGRDERTRMQDAGAALLLKMASTIDHSWRSGFSTVPDLDELQRALAKIEHEGSIKTRLAEGYAHYALYPESYLEAARASGLAENTCVIGIRSIGLGLGALVAAALGAAPAIGVRPTGHPFDRQVRADPALIRSGLVDRTVHFAIVDEGPGLSGSSFASVARWLQHHGVGMERIHFFPSHDGRPGPSATSQTLAIWEVVRSCPASRYDVLTASRGLQSWVEEKVGKLDEELREITGSSSENCQPMVDTRFARRKFIAGNARGTWLVKFAGIGAVGERKYRDAMALADAGFTPPMEGLCNGFLVQPWMEGRPPTETEYGRNRFLRVLGSYLAFRAQNLGPAGPGASLEELRKMAIYNASQAVGGRVAPVLERQLEDLPLLEKGIRRIRTDNRLHRWEWLETANGILKLDAVDHCEGHDLIGCQDIAWDVAGAIVEHDLDKEETRQLSLRVGAVSGLPVNGRLVAALVPCYLAFQLGLWSTATPQTVAAAGLVAGYAGKLSRLLQREYSIA